jgi:hypothetical protein
MSPCRLPNPRPVPCTIGEHPVVLPASALGPPAQSQGADTSYPLGKKVFAGSDERSNVFAWRVPRCVVRVRVCGSEGGSRFSVELFVAPRRINHANTLDLSLSRVLPRRPSLLFRCYAHTFIFPHTTMKKMFITPQTTTAGVSWFSTHPTRVDAAKGALLPLLWCAGASCSSCNSNAKQQHITVECGTEEFRKCFCRLACC